MEALNVKELHTEQEWLEAFPVMKQLRTHLDEGRYLELVKEAREKEGYKMFALYDGGRVVSVAGFMPMITLYYGRFVFVCDLVTDEKLRSRGYGEKLLSFVHRWAEEHGYGIVALTSGLQRKDAHRFYEEKMKYERVSFQFLKRL